MTGRQVDLTAICRLCLSDQYDILKSVFNENTNTDFLPQKVALLLQIQISKYDKLSTMVCNDCIIRLDTWFAYKRQCHRNQTKLIEWLNISKPTGQSITETTVHIKQEPDPFQHGSLPVKVEVNYEDEDFSDINTSAYSQIENEHMYLDDEDMNSLETSDDRRCPECGKMFGSSQNRKRHQNMMHAKKERRAQMAEIRRSSYGEPSQSTVNEPQQMVSRAESPMDSEPSSSGTTTIAEATSNNMGPEKDACTMDTSTIENSINISNDTNIPVNDQSVTSSEKPTEIDISTDENKKEPEVNAELKNENKPPEAATEKNQEEPIPKEEKKENADKKIDEKTTQEDEKKILFAAGLRLLQKDAAPIELEPLSKIELSYIEKCKAMVSMFHTLQCACHNVQHKTLRYLLSHLRETRIWFPLFTCYNCMISLTGRSTFTRHHSRCPKPQLETLIKLSNIRKRSEVKPRLYQNFKCNRCKFLFSFHEDFCKHIDEDHAYGNPPFYCSCRYVFDSLDEYKKHCYTSCILSYYCDICFVTTPTIEEFVKHAQEIHDTSEGFVLLQENTYIPRNHTYRHKEADDESNVLEGKRERRKSSKEPIMVQIYDKEIPPDLKEIPTRVIKKMLQLDSVSTNSDAWNKTPSRCPLCKKQYSSVNNMMRHYRTHIERREVDIPKMDDEDGENEDLYTCPDCGGVYPASKWSQHLQDKHPTKTCSECDKEFQFQSELEQHRSVHLNLKVFRDSKTQAYRSAMVSPTTENNGLAGDIMLMCEICDVIFKNKEDLKNHKLVRHDSGVRSGSSSAIGNFDDEQLSDNVETDDMNDTATSQSSDVERPYCEVCKKEFASQKSLRDHVINKHGSEYLKKEYPKKCDQCDKVCSTGAALKLHMQMHDRMNQIEKGKSEYPKKCEYCDKMCYSGAGLYIHTQMHERVTLGELKKKKDDKKKLVKGEDIKTEEDDDSYHTCKRCFKVFATKGRLREHMRTHGFNSKTNSKKNRKVLCDLCHVALDNPEALAQHKSEEHADELDGMPTLTNEMDVDEDLEDDKKDAPTIIYACDICEGVFDSKSQLRTHKEMHSRPKNKNSSLHCKYCKISFDSVKDLTKHMHVEHNESAKPKSTKDDSDGKPFKCPVCAKAFASLGAMTTHSGWHKRGLSRGENTPQARFATKLAKKEKIMKKMAAATASKQEPVDVPEFQCSTCLMELPNETALQIHVLEKHGSIDALMLVPRCNTCNQDFSTQEEYDTHKRFHDFLERQKRQEQSPQQIQTPIIQSVQSVADPGQASPKKFPCSWCNSVFSRQDTLNTHIKNHHKEHVKTEFECHECHRIFDKQNSLTIHLKVHQRQRNVTAQGGNVVHNPTSGTGKVYVCSLCNVGFSFPKDLRMHTINAHPF